MTIRLTSLAVAMAIAGCASTTVLAAATSNKSLEASVARLEQEVAVLKSQSKSNKKVAMPANASLPEKSMYMPFDPDMPGQAFVTTGPYNGIDFQYAGSDLIINSPSVNTDVQLLNIRKKILTQLAANMGTFHEVNPMHSHLLFSGNLEGQVGYNKPEGKASTSFVDVSNVALGATIFGPSDWILGYVEFDYDNSAPKDSAFTSTSSYTIYNSRVYVSKAFITVGNFSCSPFYGTIGQFYVPFGTYSSVMVSDPLTKLLARTKARSVLLGFQQQDKNALFGAIYGFRGDAHEGSDSRINNGGLNLGYRFDAGLIHGTIGGGYIADIADSAGMQVGTGFQNFERLVHRVPGYNARAALSFGQHIDFLGEYVGAATEFNPNDMSYENHGAKPNAYDLELSYSFMIFDSKPSNIAIGYGKSSQAMAMGIPLTRKSAVFSTSLLRNTLQSLEFRHDQLYAASDVGSGANNIAAPAQTGKGDNAVTFQIDYYF